MGMAPYAKIAWGIDFGDPDNTGEGFDWDETDVDSYDLEYKVMPGLFGFTEEPPEWPAGLERGTPEARAWFQEHREPYNQRLESAVPLTFEHYGYEMAGTALVLKRSLTKVDWGAETVDLATLTEPTPEEVAAFGVITDRLGFSGEIKPLLMAMYG
jgi:hypothetical protein